MNQKIVKALLSLAGIILIVTGYFIKASNPVLAIVLICVGIAFAVIYCVMSVPEIKEDIRIIKEKRGK